MAEDMMEQEGMGQEEVGEAPEGANPLDTVKKLEEALMALKEALAGSGAPKEVLAPLDSAVSSFGEFVSVMTGGAPAGKGGAVQDEAAMGAKGAMPADQYTGKGVKAVRA